MACLLDLLLERLVYCAFCIAWRTSLEGVIVKMSKRLCGGDGGGGLLGALPSHCIPDAKKVTMQGTRELKLASNMQSSENSALKTSRSENKRPRNRPHDSVTEISPPSPSSWQVKSASTNHEHQLPWHHFSQRENDPILNALPRHISSNNHTDESPIIAVNYSCLLIPMCVVAWWYWTRRKARAVVSGLLHHSSQESESEEFDDFSTW